MAADDFVAMKTPPPSAWNSYDTLPEPAGQPALLEFGAGPLSKLRGFVSRHAIAAGLDPARTVDLVLVVNEVASNSVLHGGGNGTLRIWQDDGQLVCEVSDSGYFYERLAGSKRPPPDQEGGRGLWLANQLCDLVQVRSLPHGTVVRLHTRLR